MLSIIVSLADFLLGTEQWEWHRKNISHLSVGRQLLQNVDLQKIQSSLSVKHNINKYFLFKAAVSNINVTSSAGIKSSLTEPADDGNSDYWHVFILHYLLYMFVPVFLCCFVCTLSECCFTPTECCIIISFCFAPRSRRNSFVPLCTVLHCIQMDDDRSLLSVISYYALRAV